MEQSSQIHQLDITESSTTKLDTGPVHEFRCTIAALLRQSGGNAELQRICNERSVGSIAELIVQFEQISKRQRNKILRLFQIAIHSARTSYIEY
ncbi:hypothetical protein HOD24_02655 [Candidatus Peregrinibacteria bacterium]|jgi:hypothetical protein|nr:hypothetical protein [Candidatus Peregrinibacteria bacterium]MBT4586183.1 hypothetical protein [Candidatus Peregrinibacteria bacterium]